jgi:porphobilinogen synthase
MIYPLFLQEGDQDTPIESMPGQTRWSLTGLVTEVQRAHALGIGAVVLFPRIPDALKNSTGDACSDDEGLLPQAVRAIKSACPSMNVITDVALDPYSCDGHDGILSKDGIILNDETVEVLVRQALCHARAGADVISPSDMMDGRVEAIRRGLDEAGFSQVSILAYTAKYASAFYGPFRGALDSAPRSGDKKTYQMDPANHREALRELRLDTAEGADMVMVKPAGPYLDIIRRFAEVSEVPIAAYQVSGEYLMIRSAAEAGWLDEKKVVLESLLGIRRAGADMILTYFAPMAAEWLAES